MYEPARIHNYCLSLEKVRELENDLRTRTQVKRAQLPGLEAGREGVIVAGTIILRTVMETLEFNKCLVSDYGLREGIIVDLIKKNGDVIVPIVTLCDPCQLSIADYTSGNLWILERLGDEL